MIVDQYGKPFKTANSDMVSELIEKYYRSMELTLNSYYVGPILYDQYGKELQKSNPQKTIEFRRYNKFKVT